MALHGGMALVAESQLRVMLVADELSMEGLRRLLSVRSRLVVVGEARTAARAVEEALREKPDVVVMDIQLPQGSSVEACREIHMHLPLTHVLILATVPDPTTLFPTLMAGAAGYVLRDEGSARLRDAIRTVGSGGSFIDAATAKQLHDWLNRRDPSMALTAQEDRIFDLLGEGCTNLEIADSLSMSPAAVRHACTRIYSELGIDNRTQAVALAIRRRLRQEQRPC
jgi:DNA-binding NarL/FixJ family response regulator